MSADVTEKAEESQTEALEEERKSAAVKDRRSQKTPPTDLGALGSGDPENPGIHHLAVREAGEEFYRSLITQGGQNLQIKDK